MVLNEFGKDLQRFDLKRAYLDLRFRYFREVVIPRSNYKCQCCNSEILDYAEIKIVFLNFNESDFNPDNLKVMCRSCFKKWETENYVNQTPERKLEIRKLWFEHSI